MLEHAFDPGKRQRRRPGSSFSGARTDDMEFDPVQQGAVSHRARVSRSLPKRLQVRATEAVQTVPGVQRRLQDQRSRAGKRLEQIAGRRTELLAG
jgi:hypothetical protein